MISARLDSDGTAATRDPEDLVGRGELKKNSAQEPGRWSAADVELQGRGLTGRILTAK